MSKDAASERHSRPNDRKNRASLGGARRKGRQFALALLFMSDVAKTPPAESIQAGPEVLNILLSTWEMSEQEERKLCEEIEDFGSRLFELYFADAQAIDDVINELSHDWALERMPAIDRNILRMALAELRHSEDVPISAAINEAVELAKQYGTPDSGRFVNGILGAYARREKLVTES